MVRAVPLAELGAPASERGPFLVVVAVEQNIAETKISLCTIF